MTKSNHQPPRNTTASTILLLSIPTIAIASATTASLISLASDPTAARIYGPPPTHSTTTWRVVAATYANHQFQPIPSTPLSIESNNTTLATGTTDNDGAWEASLDTTQVTPTEITVRRTDNNSILLRSTIPPNTPTWAESIQRIPPQPQCQHSNPHDDSLHIELQLMRSTMAASFPESAIIKVSSNDSPSPNTLLTLSGDGTTFDPSAALTTDEDGVAKTTLTSTLPSPSIEIHATNPSGKSGHLTCTLPVQTGALWIDPKHLANDTIHVVSPVQHRHAYLTFFNHQSRLLGTRLPLIPDASGNASASMAKPTFENFWILASPDPPGTGVERELTAWPITPNPNEPADAATISTPLLIDGFPDAIAVARDKRRTNRFRTLLILATASLVESGLIYLRLRNARHRINALEQELDLPLDGSGIGGATLWTVMVVVAFLVAVAFGSLALVSWIGGG